MSILEEKEKEIKLLKESLDLGEIANVLEEYLNRSPERGEVKVFFGRDEIVMKDMPNEIRQGTIVGLSYRNSVLQMCMEDFSELNRV